MNKDKQISLFDMFDGDIKKICYLTKSNVPITAKVDVDEFTQKAQENFDYTFDGTSKFYPFEFDDELKKLDFNILAIVGASGSGKSTFSKYFGEDEKIEWNNHKAIISHFENPNEACEKLIAAGISSIPTWCKPRNVLSVGEGFRADVARKLKNNCVIDEFTSNVDRNVALSCAKSIGNYIRQKNLKKCVFVSCHKDFIDTLCPDYVIDLDDECVYDTRRVARRKIELCMYKGGDKEYIWRIFGQHHYLSKELNKAANLYTLYYKKTAIACCYILPMPNGFIKNGWRIHRLVVNPDYQGLGVGTKFFLTICDLYKYHDATIYIRTSHIKLKRFCESHKELFKTTQRSGENIAQLVDNHDNIFKHFKNNIAYSYKYIGECQYNPNLNYDLINPTQEKKAKNNFIQMSLFDGIEGI